MALEENLTLNVDEALESIKRVEETLNDALKRFAATMRAVADILDP